MRDIVVIGGSAGAIEGVSAILQDLPADLPAAIFVVVHLFPTHESILPRLLQKSAEFPAVQPKDREKFRYGKVYVAAPDHHLLLERDSVRVLRSPKENLHRPAIDPLFRTAAFFHRERVVGVLLSGADLDGTAGLFSIKLKGGLAIVQDPKEARVPAMPFSALTHVKIDHVVPLKAIPSLIVSRVTFDARSS